MTPSTFKEPPVRRAPSAPIRFGIVGSGAVSLRHLPAFEALPEVARMVAVCDTVAAAAEALAERFPADARPEVVTSHLELIERGVDAVIIATPHHVHFPVARDLVAAGIPVLVEKPLTCTLEETRELRELGRRTNTPVVAGQVRRFVRDAEWLRRWIEADPEHFGELRSFDLQVWQNIEAYISAVGPGHWLLDGARAGGGVVTSVAIHQLDLLRYLTGADFAEVSAVGRYDPPFHGGAESSAAVLLTMRNGATGTLHATYMAPRVPYCEAMTLFGSSGTILMHATEAGQYHGPFRFASTKGRTTTTWNDQYADLEVVPVAEVAHLSPSAFVNQLHHFAHALARGEPPRNGVDDHFNTMACIQAINDSLRTGRPVEVAAA
jgi:predicted dehydrogenase